MCAEVHRKDEQLPANMDTKTVKLWLGPLDYIFCTVLEAPIGMKIVLQLKKVTFTSGLKIFMHEDIKSKPVLVYDGRKVRLLTAIVMVLIRFVC